MFNSLMLKFNAALFLLCFLVPVSFGEYIALVFSEDSYANRYIVDRVREKHQDRDTVIPFFVQGSSDKQIKVLEQIQDKVDLLFIEVLSGADVEPFLISMALNGKRVACMYACVSENVRKEFGVPFAQIDYDVIGQYSASAIRRFQRENNLPKVRIGMMTCNYLLSCREVQSYFFEHLKHFEVDYEVANEVSLSIDPDNAQRQATNAIKETVVDVWWAANIPLTKAALVSKSTINNKLAKLFGVGIDEELLRELLQPDTPLENLSGTFADAVFFWIEGEISNNEKGIKASGNAYKLVPSSFGAYNLGQFKNFIESE